MKLRDKRTFIAAIIIGLASHMYRLTNYMINNDGTNYLDTISPSWCTCLGRYLLPTVENVRGTHELSWLIGLCSIIFMALASVLIVNMFDIRHVVGQILVAWIVVANPVVTSIFSYMYTADGYFFALLLAVLCAYFAITGKDVKTGILGAISLSIALGFYQAFLTTTIMLLLIDLIMRFINPSIKTKDVWKQILRYIIIGGAGSLSYFIIINLIWKYGDVGLLPYMGIGEKSTTGIAKYIVAVKDCYIDFARVFLVRWEWTFYNKTTILMFVVSAILVIAGITKNKMWKQPLRWLMVPFILLVSPIATHIFEFISEELSYSSTSMEYGTMMMFLLPIVLWNNLNFGQGTFTEWKSFAYIRKHYTFILSMLLMLGMAFNFTVISNKAYYNIYMANKNEELLMNRILNRMEMTEGFTYDMPVMIVGSQYQVPTYVTNAPMMSGVVDKHFLICESEMIAYIEKMASVDIITQSWDIQCEIVKTPEFDAMCKWPSKDSVKIINGTMVVYLSSDNMDDYRK